MIAAIIQARMGSSRLPGKTLADMEGKPMLERLVERVRGSRRIEEILIATTDEDRDGAIVELAQRLGLRFHRGSEQDVLGRFYQTALRFGVKHIVRVTPDCPLTDPALIDRVIEAYLAGRYDYANNFGNRRFPDGLDVEVFSFDALEKAWKEAKLPSEREHVTPYMAKHPDLFRKFSLDAEADFSRFKWSVDTQRDLDSIREIYRRLSGGLFRTEDVLRVAEERNGDARPAVMNEGYYRSLGEDPAVPEKTRSLRESEALGKRALERIPGGSQTFSKGPTQFVQGVAPSFLARGKGCRVWDVDGNEYVDCAMALGSVILGYADPDVDEAVRRQIDLGVSLSLPHPLELELAEMICEMVPCAEMVRFGKNGSDATSGAVRLARAFTGRETVACCGYHGWQDWYIGTTTRNLGVPRGVRDLTMPFAYNNTRELEEILVRNRGKVAAVILEPVGVEEPKDGFLEEVKRLSKEHGALLIFDEVLTGFRVAPGGAQEYYGVTPDIACFSKGMANGYPLSAVAGRREIMRRFEDVFFSFTFGGETVSLAAGLATLRKIRDKRATDHFWTQGRKLRDGFNVLAGIFGLGPVCSCVGLPPRNVVQFRGKEEESLLLKSLFQQECMKRGVLFSGPNHACLSHTDSDVDTILRVYRTALEQLALALREGDVRARLEGKPVEPVFRRP